MKVYLNNLHSRYTQQSQLAKYQVEPESIFSRSFMAGNTSGTGGVSQPHFLSNDPLILSGGTSERSVLPLRREFNTVANRQMWQDRRNRRIKNQESTSRWLNDLNIPCCSRSCKTLIPSDLYIPDRNFLLDSKRTEKERKEFLDET